MTNELSEAQTKRWMEAWASDVRQFLLSDEERMTQWIAFRQDQERARAKGIDTTRPRHMIKIADHIYFCQPFDQDK